MGGCNGRNAHRTSMSEWEGTFHINLLELMGGAFAVKTFARNRQDVHICLRMDNKTMCAAYVHDSTIFKVEGHGPTIDTNTVQIGIR